jgi:hypothetical protein
MPVSVSTSTLRDVYNTALRFIGERPYEIDDDENNTRALARDAVRSALQVFENSHDWSFARRMVTASSWVDEVAVVQRFTKLHGVYVNNSEFDKMTPLTEVSLDNMRALKRVPLTGVTGTLCSIYAQQDAESVIISPYPTDAPGRANYFFDISAVLKRPANDADTFDIPEEWIWLFIKQVCVQLALTHLNDRETMTLFSASYTDELNKSISRNQMTGPYQGNLYKNRYGRNWR